MSELPAGKLSKSKWHHNKANVKAPLCADNDIDWASMSQMTHVNYSFGQRIIPWFRAKYKRTQRSKLLWFFEYMKSSLAYKFKVYCEELSKV